MRPRLLCVVSVAALWFCLGIGLANAQQKKVTLLIHPTVYQITGGETGVIADFKKRTGVEVEVVSLPTIQLHEKIQASYCTSSRICDTVCGTGYRRRSR